MADPDLEALVSPKIRAAIQAAIDKIGVKDFLEITGIDREELESILGKGETYVGVGLVTLACNINKSHGDMDPSHSSITECLKGTAIRMNHPNIPGKATKSTAPRPVRPFTKNPTRQGNFYERRSFRLLGFSANTFTFLVLGYFLGGIGLSPLAGQPSCTGVTISPPGISPCIGSIIGIVVGAIAGLGYTYYYFVKKM
jgi:hypothetical protein